MPPLPDGYSPYQHLNEADMAELQQQQQEQQALIENSIGVDNVLHEVLKNSHISACTDVQTLDSTPSLITDENGLSSNGFIHSILTRRLGLIVGCCLGIIVFIVMISVLSYVKLKKQRIENAKRQAAMPPEYISYRHFSIPNEELTRTNASSAAAVAAAAAASAQASAAAAAAAAQQAVAQTSATTHTMSSVPSGISAHISGTSLSTSLATTTAATTPIGGVALPMAKSGSRSPIVGIGGLVVENGNALDLNSAGGSAGTVVAVAVSASPVNGAINTHGTLGHSHGHNHSHNHHSHNHRPNNGAIAGAGAGGGAGGGGGGGYMAAGVVLNTNHLSVC